MAFKDNNVLKVLLAKRNKWSERLSQKGTGTDKSTEGLARSQQRTTG